MTSRCDRLRDATDEFHISLHLLLNAQGMFHTLQTTLPSTLHEFMEAQHTLIQAHNRFMQAHHQLIQANVAMLSTESWQVHTLQCDESIEPSKDNLCSPTIPSPPTLHRFETIGFTTPAPKSSVARKLFP